MKAIIIQRPFEIKIGDVDQPRIGKKDILVKVKAVGICASEIHAYQGVHPWRVPPVISGHEFSGEVVGVGADVKGFIVGDRVTACPIISCGVCEYCLSGKSNLCENVKILGTPQWPGPFGEYVSIPYTVAHKLPDNVSFEEGALIEPFAVGVHTIRRTNLKSGQTALIIGAGAIGLCTLIAAKLLNIKTLVCEINDFKINVAKKLGADAVVNPLTQDLREALKSFGMPKGVDATIDCAGTKESILNAIDSVKKAGTVVITALFKSRAEIDPRIIMSRELNIIGSLMYTGDEFRQAVESCELVKNSLRQLITHRMKFENAEEAFKLMLENKAIRIILSP